MDNLTDNQNIKNDMNSYAEWLAASAAHDAFYAPHPQGGMYKRDVNAVQFLYIVTGSDREFINSIMDGMRSAPIGTGGVGGVFRTFVFVVDFSDPGNSDFGMFLKEQQEANIRARVLTECIIVDYRRAAYFKVGGGRIQDKELKKILDETPLVVKMSAEKRQEWTEIRKTSIKRGLSDVRPKRANASILSSAIIIVFINALLFFIDLLFFAKTGERPIENFGIQHNQLVWDGEWWRIITSIFLHADLSHIGGNMVMLILTSRILRNFYSDIQYWIIYMASGIIGSLSTLFFMEPEISSLGASGAVMGLGGVLFFRMFFGTNSKYFRKAANCITMVAIIAYNLIYGLTVTEINNWAHYTGFLTGFLAAWFIHLVQKDKDKNKKQTSA